MIEKLTGLATMRDDRAVSPIAALARKKKWTAWRKTTQLRRACLQALAKIGSAKPKHSIAELATSGDYFLKRIARKAAA